MPTKRVDRLAVCVDEEVELKNPGRVKDKEQPRNDAVPE